MRFALLVLATLVLAGCQAPPDESVAPPSASEGVAPPAATTTPPGTTGESPETSNAVGQRGHALEGQRAPNYAGQTIDGEATQLSDLQGTPVFLHVWASWCTVCDREKPALRALHEEYNGTVQFVHVSVDDHAFEDAMRRDAATFPGTHWWDPEDDIRPTFDVHYQPVTIFMHADGTVQSVWQGQREDRTTLRGNEDLAREVLDWLVAAA